MAIYEVTYTESYVGSYMVEAANEEEAAEIVKNDIFEGEDMLRILAMIAVAR